MENLFDSILFKRSIMAEIQTQTRPSTGIKKNKRLSTRVDLTPMVDLGFLLITFFIFTTALSDPSVISLPLPNEQKTDNPRLTGERKTISIFLEENNQIQYYEGSNKTQIFKTNYSKEGLRKILLLKIRQVKNEFGRNAEPVVLIFPTRGCTYGNLVDVLDEMMINGLKKYMLLDKEV